MALTRAGMAPELRRRVRVRHTPAGVDLPEPDPGWQNDLLLLHVDASRQGDAPGDDAEARRILREEMGLDEPDA